MTKFNNDYFKNILPKRPENSHKGTFGHVLNIAGSGFYTGAAYFSSISALKIGCGKITLASCESGLKSVSSLSPDVILLPLEESKENTIAPQGLKKIVPKLQDYQAISIGCGLSVDKHTNKFFVKLIKTLKDFQTPIVIDASGLNILAISPHTLPLNTILTPHPKELSRLMSVDIENILSQPEFWVKKCCEKYHCTTVLKLHKTMVADNKGHFYINTTGNSALSHGGSGDILCGMITGLLSQGLGCFEASCLGVYLHGLSAELASKELTEYSTLSSDLLNYIPKAIKTII